MNDVSANTHVPHHRGGGDVNRPAHVPDELVVDYDGLGDMSIDKMLEQVEEWRRLGPALWTDRNDGHWLVTSSAGCRQVLTNPALFSSSLKGASLAIVERERTIPLELEGSEHRAYRRAINPLFAPVRVQVLERDVREAAQSFLEKIHVHGDCEVVSQYARPLASSMFLSLMDWPLEDRDRLEHWVEIYLNGYRGATAEELRRAKIEAHTQITDYCRSKLAERRAHPSEDMTSAVVQAEIDGQPIPERELLGMLVLLMVAGLDTTQSVTSRSIRHLAAHPADQDFVRTNPGQIPIVVEELLRFSAPAGPNRTAVADTEIGGVAIGKGERVHCMIQAGNRDSSEFDHPAAVDFTRDVNRHMTFGLGPHKCLGASLARVVVGAALDEWHKSIPHYTLASSTSHVGGVWGMENVRVEFEPATAA
jgi:cytochrome P450